MNTRRLKRIVPTVYTHCVRNKTCLVESGKPILAQHKYNTTSTEYGRSSSHEDYLSSHSPSSSSSSSPINHTPSIIIIEPDTNNNTPSILSKRTNTKPITSYTNRNINTTNNIFPTNNNTNKTNNNTSACCRTNDTQTTCNTNTNHTNTCCNADTTKTDNVTNNKTDTQQIIVPVSSQPAHTIGVNLHTCEAAQIASNSFYRRPLPDTLIAFSSSEGRMLFREALAQGYMEGYFALAEQFVSQSEPAYCGPATLSMCLNALNIDPNRLWKGPWRWFAEDMLDCCTPLDVVKKRGITFTEFACLAKCNGASVTAVRGDESSLDSFRQAIKEATSQQSLHMVVSYSRKVLGQTGQGHYSPVGGYHPQKDLALMLDVARFKYAPHWVPVETLWNSMKALDEETKKPRGYYLLTRSQDHRPPAVCRITSKTMWAAVASHLSSTTFPLTHTAAQMVEALVRQLPPEASQVLQTYPDELVGRLPREHADMTNKFFGEIAQSEMCTIVREVLSKMEATPYHAQYGAEIVCVLLFACPTQLFGALSAEVRDDLARVRSLDSFSKDVQTEILQIREQMFLALKSNCKQCKQEGPGAKG